MEKQGECSSTSVKTLNESGLSYVPQRFVLPSLQRPDPSLNHSADLPTVDLSTLHQPFLRTVAINGIQKACKEFGFFQVINHGIPNSVMNDALEVAMDFFNLPIKEKMLLLSANVHEPVRYGSSLNQVRDKVQFWRDFIKHYSQPICKWIHLWPANPPSYKEKMGNYAKAGQVLYKQLVEVVIEGLGLEANYLQDEIEEGSQVVATNYHPACPQPELTLGMPPHSDYGSLTILLQSCQGLQILDCNKNWIPVPVAEGAPIFQLQDQLEVMSNGLYKSVVHRVTLSPEKNRLSIASSQPTFEQENGASTSARGQTTPSDLQ
ncbi:flavonol synthase/flavanone 3-hydroxylase-like [Tripterygium wilfordii]|uniref:Flavonol synthase/flavanone 3-hydroxylase-like n=1 Tax=Tripterygium wilfordii TaxID=458696 RepID=A0A7J7CFX7_TRIWF|nr:flavonol synthase/flavanone 3-hydroxylase-like [Tripterygium wilfordii]